MQNTFQKFFFAIIFLVTVGTFVQMYLEHRENLEQMDCVDRTRDLLDYLTEGKSKEEYLIWPDDPMVRDSAVVLLNGWGREARLDKYKYTQNDSGYTEEILVFYPGVPAGPEALDSALLTVGVHVTWNKDNRRSTWRAALEIVPIVK